MADESAAAAFSSLNLRHDPMAGAARPSSLLAVAKRNLEHIEYIHSLTPGKCLASPRQITCYVHLSPLAFSKIEARSIFNFPMGMPLLVGSMRAHLVTRGAEQPQGPCLLIGTENYSAFS